MKAFATEKTIKTRPLYKLLLLGITQLSGAFVLFRLGVLTIKVDWINAVCTLSSLGLLAWAIYVFKMFSRYFSLKEKTIVFKKGRFSFLGIELEYSSIKDFQIKTYDSDLTLDIYMKEYSEPIPLSASYLKLKDFHEVFKTLAEIQSQNHPEEYRPRPLR